MEEINFFTLPFSGTILVGSLGLPQSIAVLVGSLIAKKIAKGSSYFICERWQQSLDQHKALFIQFVLLAVSCAFTTV
jgi:hypothetical protein